MPMMTEVPRNPERIITVNRKPGLLNLDKSDDVQMSQVISEWLKHRSNLVKASTYQNYEAIISSYIQPMIGNVKLHQLTAQLLNNSIDENIYGKGVSDTRAFDIIAVLKSILQYTADNYGVYVNTKKLQYNPKNQKHNEFLTEVEQEKLIDVLLRNTDLCKAGILLCLYSGIQVSEICALKWRDIDIAEKSINIERIVYRIKNTESDFPKTIIVTESPKSDSGIRKVPLNSSVAKIIQQMGEYSPESYFLTGTDKLIEPRNYQYKLKTYMQQAGLSELSFNILRNTFAENCIKAGCSAESLARLLGHSNIKITIDSYGQLFEKYQKRFSVDLLPVIR